MLAAKSDYSWRHKFVLLLTVVLLWLSSLALDAVKKSKSGDEDKASYMLIRPYAIRLLPYCLRIHSFTLSND